MVGDFIIRSRRKGELYKISDISFDKRAARTPGEVDQVKRFFTTNLGKGEAAGIVEIFIRVVYPRLLRPYRPGLEHKH